MNKLVLDMTGLSMHERQGLSTHIQHGLFSLGFRWTRNEDGAHVHHQHADAITISDDDAVSKTGFMGYVPKGSMNDATREKMTGNGAQFFDAKQGGSQFLLAARRWAGQKREEMRAARSQTMPPEIMALLSMLFGRDDEGVMSGKAHEGMSPATLKRIAIEEGGMVQACGDGVTLIVTRNGVYVDDTDYRERLERMGMALHQQCFPQGG